MRSWWQFGLAALLLWQAGEAGSNAASPDQMLYERAVVVPPSDVGGDVCAVLDAAALAHAANASGDDFRVVARQGAAGVEWREVPFRLAESGVQPEEALPAEVEDVRVTSHGLRFLLKIPPRVYSALDLRLTLQNFVGTASVFVSDPKGAGGAQLGVFPIYDLTGRGLGRSTRLTLAETRLPFLRVELQLWSEHHKKLAGLNAATVQGAEVPPSREAETLYTPVAGATPVRSANANQPTDALWEARMTVPAHLPIERLTVQLTPEFRGSFFSTVTLDARSSNASGPSPGVERFSGAVSQIALPEWLDVSRAELQARRLSFDTPLAINLRTPAEVRIAIHQSAALPMPVHAVLLEMRQRTICFRSEPGESYLLRYGDPYLGAPVYPLVKKEVGPTLSAFQQTDSSASRVESLPHTGSLGHEQAIGKSERAPLQRPSIMGEPELRYLGVLAVVGALAAWLRARSRSRREK